MDLHTFFHEQDELMNLSDDEMDEYNARMRSLRRRQSRNVSKESKTGTSSVLLKTTENNSRNSEDDTHSTAEILIEHGSTNLDGFQSTSTPTRDRKRKIDSSVPPERPQLKRSRLTQSNSPGASNRRFHATSKSTDKTEPIASTSRVQLDPVSNPATVLERKCSGSVSRHSDQQALSARRTDTLLDLSPELDCASFEGNISTSDIRSISPKSVNINSNAASSPIEDPSAFSAVVEPDSGLLPTNRHPVKQETTLLFDLQERIGKRLQQQGSSRDSTARIRDRKVVKSKSAKESAPKQHWNNAVGADESSIISVSSSSSLPAMQTTLPAADTASKKPPMKASKTAKDLSKKSSPTGKDVATDVKTSSKQSTGKDDAVDTKALAKKPSTAGKAAATGAKALPKKSSAKGKDVPVKMSVFEYTTKIQAEADAPESANKNTKRVQFLKNANIFYVGLDFHSPKVGEGTRKRMEIMLQHGARLIPVYDPEVVTHIVIEDFVSKTGPGAVLHATGLKKLSDIPNHIPTVKWSWVSAGKKVNSSLTRGGKERPIVIPKFFDHAAYADRMDAGDPVPQINPKWKLRKELAKSGSKKDEEFSRISDFSDDEDRAASPKSEAVSRQSSVAQASSSRVPLNFHSLMPHVQNGDDPLAEFYEQAKAEQAQTFGRYGEEDDTDASEAESKAQPSHVNRHRSAQGWTCDKAPQRGACVNQDIIDKLQELQDLHKAKPGNEEHWRVYTYTRVIRALRDYPTRITEFEQAEAIPHVGPKTAQKIMEIINTGNLRRIQYEKTEDVEVCKVFTGIYGVGQNVAMRWYKNGCRTLDDLRTGKDGVKLTAAQKIGLEFYDDINDRMPREEARALFELIKPIALSIDPKLFVEIMGSYRRGKADCGDIDIMITRCPDDGKTHRGVLRRLLQKLHEAGIITEDLAVPDDMNDLEAIYRGLCRLPQEGSRRRRIDFLTVPWKSKGGALLYYTGDDIFNRSMRLKANKMGYSLNQRGLFEGVVRDPTNRMIKLNTGNLVASETEQEIFAKLNVPWQEPHERVRNI